MGAMGGCWEGKEASPGATVRVLGYKAFGDGQRQQDGQGVSSLATARWRQRGG